MGLLMRGRQESTPWAIGGTPEVHRGRADFAALSVVRTKPGRADSAVSWSKSCSDKLALRQVMSLLTCTTEPFFDREGFYLHTLVLPHDQYDAAAFERCFAGRGLAAFQEYHAIRVLTTTAQFEQRQQDAAGPVAFAPSPLSLVFVLGYGREVLTQGRKLGVPQRHANTPRAASIVSRYVMFRLMASLMAESEQTRPQLPESYSSLKSQGVARRGVKARATTVLTPWRDNVEDDFCMHI